MRAISILDTAIWDRNARAAKLPLYKYLGATHLGSVPAYASGGYYLDGKTPEMLGEEMAGYVALGLDAVKMKVGRGDPRSEEARIAAEIPSAIMLERFIELQNSDLRFQISQIAR